MATSPAAHTTGIDAAKREDQTAPRIPWPRRLAAGLMLPREHGAWAMLLMPYLVGTLAAGWGGWPSFLLLVAVLLLFSASRPLEVALQSSARPREPKGAGAGLSPARAGDYGGEMRERSHRALVHLSAYLGLGGGAGLLLLVVFQRWDLLALGLASGAALALQLPLKRQRLDRGRPARLLSIAALSATGPAAYYAASGMLDRHAAAVWGLAFLYSAAGLFYVRLIYQPPARLKLETPQRLRARAGRQMAAYLAVATLAVAGLTAFGWMPPLAGLALLPTIAKAAWAWAKPEYRPTLKQVGLTEIGHSSLFALLAVVAIVAWR